jgi:beta-1,2-mannobiose phosphorylase / 1,2-beta-oligomannan phosphorylase
MDGVEICGEPERLVFRRPSGLEEFFVLSPYAVYRNQKYEMLVRLVNRDDDPAKKVSRIHYASSSDGVAFDIGREVIGPGTADAPDGAGCEDPSVVRWGDSYRVFYSGYNAQRKVSSMLGATGNVLSELTKVGTVVEPSDVFANPKEAALVPVPGGFRMFFEYARHGASLIGVADAARLEGPWKYGTSPLEPRPKNFDSWHLSPSSAIPCDDGTHVLFYNGASKETAWRIGWARLDETASVVLARPETPLVRPFGLQAGDSDIAFAASAVVDRPDRVWLYYSIADRKPYRIPVSIQGATFVD